MNYKIKNLEKHTDDRGTLIELLRSDQVGTFNQIYTATIKPGYSRGSHYHKERKEWFCVISGEGIYRIQDVETLDIEEIIIKEGDFKQIELKPGLWHQITNTGEKDLIFVSAISDLYDKDNPDTFTL